MIFAIWLMADRLVILWERLLVWFGERDNVGVEKYCRRSIALMMFLDDVMAEVFHQLHIVYVYWA